MKKLLVFILFPVASVFFFSSCKKDVTASEKERSQRLEANLIMDKSLFANSIKDRNSKNAFEIIKVTRKNEVLNLTVKGGGSVESFQFIWDGIILFSYPASIQLLLKYDNSKQDFDPNKELIISVNLQKILGDKHDVKDFRFHVINGSKLETVIINPEGVSTKENK